MGKIGQTIIIKPIRYNVFHGFLLILYTKPTLKNINNYLSNNVKSLLESGLTPTQIRKTENISLVNAYDTYSTYVPMCISA